MKVEAGLKTQDALVELEGVFFAGGCVLRGCRAQHNWPHGQKRRFVNTKRLQEKNREHL